MSRWNPFDDEARYVDRFGLLLVVTTIAVITLSLVDLSADSADLTADLGVLAVSIFVAATLLLSLRASGVKRRYRIVADVLLGLGVVAALLLALANVLSDFEVAQSTGTPSILWIVLSLVAPVLVVRRLLQHSRASAKTLLGAVSAFLLIALAFNFAFLAVDTWDGPFFGEDEPTTSFMYFSLVTITTLGYGDLSPAEPLGRLLATIEAVVGQVYLVTFVAMIVGFLVGQRQRGHKRTESD